jgi:SAM-dependent methyltransferase
MTMVAGKTMAAETYAKKYLEEMEFERHLIDARQRCCLDFLSDVSCRSVLEVGCGPHLLFNRISPDEAGIEKWVIVEPSTLYADIARERFGSDAQVEVVVGYLEAELAQLTAFAPEGYDAVLLSGLLHETTEPQGLLEAAVGLTRSGGALLVNVPNARSMHRLLAVEMGLIERPDALSQRNQELGQSFVYDRDSLVELIERVGLVEPQFSGYMLKLFTNDQMRQVIEMFGEQMVEGLIGLGHRFAEHAAEIAVRARKP